MTERILIVGGSGYLGGFLRRQLLGYRSAVVASLDRSSGCDITHREKVRELFRQFRPTVVISCLKYGSVHDYEADACEAIRVHVDGTRLIADLTDDHKAYLIRFSTSYVFGGDGQLRTEAEVPDAKSVFGLVSLAAERAWMTGGLILRTSGVYGYYSPRNNWDIWGLQRLRQGRRTPAYHNRFTTPTYIYDLGRIVQQAILDRHIGLYHASGPDRMSRYEFFQMLARRNGFPEELVELGLDDDALRPCDTSLSNRKLCDDFGLHMTSVSSGLDAANY